MNTSWHKELQKIAQDASLRTSAEAIASFGPALRRVPLSASEISEIRRPILPDLGAILRPPDFEQPNFERALTL